MPDWWTRRGYFELTGSSLSGLDTPADCVRYIRKVCRELLEVLQEFDALELQAESEADDAALVKARKRIDSLVETTAECIFQALKRKARLKAEA